MQYLKKVASDIVKILFEDRNHKSLLTFKKWEESGNGASFVITDENGENYRVVVTKDNSNRIGKVFPFRTGEVKKCFELIPKGTRYHRTFKAPANGYFIGDEIIFVNEDCTDVLIKTLFKIVYISTDNKSFNFVSTGATVNTGDTEKLNTLLQRLKEE